MYAADIVSGDSGQCVAMKKFKPRRWARFLSFGNNLNVLTRYRNARRARVGAKVGHLPRARLICQSQLARNQNRLPNRKPQFVILKARLEKFKRFGRRGVEQAPQFFFRFFRAAHSIRPSVKLHLFR